MTSPARRSEDACALCGGPLLDEGPLRLPFRCHGRSDPLWPLNEATVHARCLTETPLGRRWTAAMRQVEAGQRGWPPTCDACGARIESRPERFGAVGFLTSNPESPAFAFSGVCAHRGCLPRWPRRAALREALARLRDDTEVVAADGARPARGPLDASIDELDAVARGVPADRPLAWLEVGVWAVAVVGLGLFTLLVVLFALASRAIGEM